MSLRRAAGLGLVLAAGAACSSGREYENNDLILLTAYTAKELCTCAFVLEQSDEFCGRWTRASPNVKTFRIDRGARSVEAQAILFWGAKARYAGPRAGCILE